MSRTRNEVTVALAGAAVAAACVGIHCAQRGSIPEGAGGVDVSSGYEVGTSSSSGSSVATTGGFGGHVPVENSPPPDTPDPNACNPGKLPWFVPAGWHEYLDWSCTCRFYVPESKDALPPPVQWEPCALAPNGIQCRSMVLNWSDELGPIALNPQFDRNPDGTAVLYIARAYEQSHSVHMIADADGPVRTAMILDWGGRRWHELSCYLHNEAIGEGHVLFFPRGHESEAITMSKHVGIIGGNVDLLSLPLLQHQINDIPYKPSWRCGAKWLVRMAGAAELTAYPWDMSSETFVTSPAVDPEGLKADELVVSGETLFWRTGTLKRSGINVWDPVSGMRPFIRWTHEYTRGAGNFGTDGVDMVWSYGEGKLPNDTAYPIRSVMTAPFTKDPEKLQPRRLTSQPRPYVAGKPYRVGCGYAIGVGAMNDTHVIRLSDGHWWLVPDDPAQKFSMPLGVTCDEIFVAGVMGGQFNIARIRIDSLGPGNPAD